MELDRTIQNGVVLLDERHAFSDGTRVKIVLDSSAATKDHPHSTLGQRLLKHAGTVLDLPAELAEQNDHYLCGTPKA